MGSDSIIFLNNLIFETIPLCSCCLDYQQLFTFTSVASDLFEKNRYEICLLVMFLSLVSGQSKLGSS